MKISRLYIILIVAAMAICSGFDAHAYQISYYATSSKLSSGRWVKIKVTQTGINEITNEQLLEMGFNDPSKVCVYGYGGVCLSNAFEATHPDDLPAQPILRMSDKILFYGESDVRVNLTNDVYTAEIKRNTYSSAGYYFLSDVAPTASPSPTNMSYNSSAINQRNTHTSMQIYEEEKICPSRGTYRFFGRSFKDYPSQTIEFVAIDADTSLLVENPDSFATGYFKYAWAGKSINEMTIKFTTNGLKVKNQSHKPLAAIPSSSELQYNWKTGEIDVAMKPNDDSLYSFTASVYSRAAMAFGAIDYATFAYKRYNNIAHDNQLRMVFDNVSSNNVFVLSGANANTKVWNVSSPINVFAYRTVFDSSTGILKGTFEKRYSSSTGHAYLIAFDPTKPQYKVEYAGVVENQNLHSNVSPHMLIITNASMKKYAEQLAQYHRTYQGMRVHVFDQEQIFNEFSSGTPSAIAYRRLAKMFYDRNTSRFKYLLFYGASSYDNRGVILDRKDNLVTYQCETKNDANDETRSYCSDAFFGMLSDDYSQSTIHYTYMDINVSRIPASNEQEATNVNEKTLEYLLNPPANSSRNRALLLCDNGDFNSHLLQTEAVCDTIQKLAPHVTLTKSYCTLYPWTVANDAVEGRRVTKNALAAGQQFFFYTGHGKPESLATEVLWNQNYVEETNYDVHPITYLATCNALSFDRGSNIGETMLYKRTGGSIAVISSGRTVYRDCNQVLSIGLADALYSAQQGETIGDMYRKARNSAIKFAVDSAERVYGINTLCFNMIGDPALPLSVPTHKVKINRVNGADVDSITPYYVYPKFSNEIAGEILDSQGNVDETFNGMVVLSLYESPVETKTHTQGDDEELTIVRDEDLLVEVSVPVVAGLFNATVVPPIPVRPMISNRITAYAVNNDNTITANGLSKNVVISDIDDQYVSEDVTAPEILSMYLNDETFADGDYLGSDVTLYATIAHDESGICTASQALGMVTKLTLDGEKSFPEIASMISAGEDGISHLNFPINGLNDGLHTLTLDVVDNVGNRSNSTISFYVLNQSVVSTVKVAEQPARTMATIELEHNFHYEPTGRLVIEDTEGNVVFSEPDCTFPYQWNLTDAEGNAVPDGAYNCYAILKAQKQYSSTPKVKIIVIKQ